MLYWAAMCGHAAAVKTHMGEFSSYRELTAIMTMKKYDSFSPAVRNEIQAHFADLWSDHVDTEYLDKLNNLSLIRQVGGLEKDNTRLLYFPPTMRFTLATRIHTEHDPLPGSPDLLFRHTPRRAVQLGLETEPLRSIVITPFMWRSLAPLFSPVLAHIIDPVRYPLPTKQ
jgi:hypothetical protein